MKIENPRSEIVSAPGPGAGALVRDRTLSILRGVFAIDLRSLAALRIGTATLLLVDLCQRSTDLAGLYSDYGTMPRTLLIERVSSSPWCVSLHLISGECAVEFVLFAMAAVFALGLLVGIQTRISTVASWFFLVSLHYRNPIILQGGDVLLRMLLFWGIFLPLGARFSIDSARSQSMPACGRVPPAANVALLLQIAFVYWFAASMKTDPAWTRDYTALYYALSLDHFSTAAGKLLLPHHELLKVLTFASLWIEIVGPMIALFGGLLSYRVRLAAILAFIGFHLSMGVCLKLGLFPLICSVAWLAFLPREFWDKASRALHPFKSRWEFMASAHGIGARARAAGDSFISHLRKFGIYPESRVYAPSAVAGMAVSFFLMYVLCWNLRMVNPGRYTRWFPHELDCIGWLSGTAQVWDMFSPCPLKEGGWFVMPARLASGREVDVFRGGAPVSWDKPRLVSAMYKNDRWRKYTVLLAARANANWRKDFARNLCREWNEGHSRWEKIVGLSIYLMEQDTLPNYQYSEPKPILLWEQH